MKVSVESAVELIRAAPELAAGAARAREAVLDDADLEDAELVRRARAGDRSARAALYHRHAPDIGNLALRLVRDRQVAADVLQDTFVIAFETLETLREPEHARSWLRTIAIRQVQRRFRRRRLLQRLGIGSAPSEVRLEDLAVAGADQEARAELARVDRALARLPERARLVWTLRMLEDASLPEIAQACGASLATVKRDFTLAQDEIRRAVAEDER